MNIRHAKGEASDRLWGLARGLGRFTRGELFGATNIDISTVNEFLDRYEEAGLLSCDRRQEGNIYAVVDARAERPRVSCGVVLDRTGQEQIWTAMRIRRVFTARDIANYDARRRAARVAQGGG